MAVERVTGELVPELHPPALPPGCQLLWDTFVELHNARGGNGMGTPTPIGWSDVLAWQQVQQVTLSAWEVETLMSLDQVAIKTLMEKKP
jgi:hypothetical protein